MASSKEQGSSLAEVITGAQERIGSNLNTARQRERSLKYAQPADYIYPERVIDGQEILKVDREIKAAQEGQLLLTKWGHYLGHPEIIEDIDLHRRRIAELRKQLANTQKYRRSENKKTRKRHSKNLPTKEMEKELKEHQQALAKYKADGAAPDEILSGRKDKQDLTTESGQITAEAVIKFRKINKGEKIEETSVIGQVAGETVEQAAQPAVGDQAQQEVSATAQPQPAEEPLVQDQEVSKQGVQLPEDPMERAALLQQTIDQFKEGDQLLTWETLLSAFKLSQEQYDKFLQKQKTEMEAGQQEGGQPNEEEAKEKQKQLAVGIEDKNKPAEPTLQAATTQIEFTAEGINQARTAGRLDEFSLKQIVEAIERNWLKKEDVNRQALKERMDREGITYIDLNKLLGPELQSTTSGESTPPSVVEEKKGFKKFVDGLKDNATSIIEAIKRDPKSAAMAFGLGLISGSLPGIAAGGVIGALTATGVLIGLPALAVTGVGIGAGIVLYKAKKSLEDKWITSRLKKQFTKVAKVREGVGVETDITTLSNELQEKINRDVKSYLSTFAIGQAISYAGFSYGINMKVSNYLESLIPKIDIRMPSKPQSQKSFLPKGEQMGSTTASKSQAISGSADKLKQLRDTSETYMNLPQTAVKIAEETTKAAESTVYIPDVSSGNQLAQPAYEAGKTAVEKVAEVIPLAHETYTVIPGDNFSTIVQRLIGAGADSYGESFTRFFIDNHELFMSKPGIYGEAAKELYKYLLAHPNEVPRGATRALWEMFMKATHLINPGDVVKYTIYG